MKFMFDRHNVSSSADTYIMIFCILIAPPSYKMQNPCVCLMSCDLRIFVLSFVSNMHERAFSLFICISGESIKFEAYTALNLLFTDC